MRRGSALPLTIPMGRFSVRVNCKDREKWQSRSSEDWSSTNTLKMVQNVSLQDSYPDAIGIDCSVMLWVRGRCAEAMSPCSGLSRAVFEGRPSACRPTIVGLFGGAVRGANLRLRCFVLYALSVLCTEQLDLATRQGSLLSN